MAPRVHFQLLYIHSWLFGFVFLVVVFYFNLWHFYIFPSLSLSFSVFPRGSGGGYRAAEWLYSQPFPYPRRLISLHLKVEQCTLEYHRIVTYGTEANSDNLYRACSISPAHVYSCIVTSEAGFALQPRWMENKVMIKAWPLSGLHHFAAGTMLRGRRQWDV